MKNVKQLYFLLFLLIARAAWAQELPEYEWWSLPLMSKPTLIQSVPLFHGFTVGWRPKGLHAKQQLIDAIDFNSTIELMPSYEWFRHLQFNGQAVSFEKEYTEKTLLRNASTPYVQYALHNQISKNTSMFQLKTEQTFKGWDWGVNGVLLKKWNSQDWLGPIEQQGIQGYLSHSSTNRLRWIIQYSGNHQFRTVLSATAKEVYDLVKTNEFNPNWGWYHGQMLFVNNRNLKSHVLQMTIEKKFSPLHWMRWSVASVLMQNERQSLTWNQTRDPRPDYYKYLPSYQKDSAAYHQLYDYLSSHPQKLQFDFDQMEKINMQSKIGQSKYVIDKNNQVGYQQRIAFEWHFENQYHLTMHNRMQWGWDKSLNSHQLADLLGGTIYPNQLQWINEGESGNDFQANIKDTSMLHVGSMWGSNYSLRQNALQSHQELSWRWYRGEWSLDWQAELLQLSRHSVIQNQLYQNSIGNAVLPNQWNQSLALRSTYMFNGRWYLYGMLQLEQEHPKANTLYIDPSIQSGVSSFAYPIKGQWNLISLVHKGMKWDGQIDLYQLNKWGISGHENFYHDYFNAFVYGMYGNENRLTRGIDLSLEKEWYGVWKGSVVGSFKNEIITNNPMYEIRNVNDLFKMESGQLLLKGLPFSNSAKWYGATLIEYKPNLKWQFSINHIWAASRPINYNYFKRTNWVKQHVLSDSLWNQLLKVDQVPSTHVVEGSILRSSYTKQKSTLLKWQWKLQWQYLFGSNDIPLYVNESSRFDYNTFSNKKFPSKWLVMQPLSLRFSVLFQIQ